MLSARGVSNHEFSKHNFVRWPVQYVQHICAVCYSPRSRGKVSICAAAKRASRTRAASRRIIQVHLKRSARARVRANFKHATNFKHYINCATNFISNFITNFTTNSTTNFKHSTNSATNFTTNFITNFTTHSAAYFATNSATT
jgi:hypothetical protein